ncbi:MAG: hypothetical protein ACKO3R_10890 [bacterium]
MKKHSAIFYLFLFFFTLDLYSSYSEVFANSTLAQHHIKNQILPAELAPLLNTKAKLMANYTPILALRGLGHSKIYRKKGTAHLERFYYEKDAKTPYQKLILNIYVSSTKWNDRIIDAKGTVNSYPIVYKNIMELSLPRKAKMNIYCNVGAFNLMSLYVESDGNAMTNNVVGYFGGKSVQYFTKHRISEGILAGSAYNMNVEGTVNPKTNLLELISKGNLDEVNIEGTGKEFADGHFEFIEYFNDIKVKTFLHIKELQ